MRFHEAAQLKDEIDHMAFWTANIEVKETEHGLSVSRDYGIRLTYDNPLTGTNITEPFTVWSKEEWLRVKANIEPTKRRKRW